MKQRIIKVCTIFLLSVFLWGGIWRSLDRIRKVKGVSTNVSSSEIISLTNLVRLNQDISSLKPNQYLQEAANSKAKDMIEKDYFDHVDENGDGPWRFINQSEYIYQHAGENLARNFNSAEEVVDAWLLSEEHKNNMLNPLFSDIGVAVIENKDQVIIVQILASEIPSDLIDQFEKYQKDFVFTTPISGQKNNVNPNIALTIFSLFITLSTVSIGLVLFHLVKNQSGGFKSPKIQHWKNK